MRPLTNFFPRKSYTVIAYAVKEEKYILKIVEPAAIIKLLPYPWKILKPLPFKNCQFLIKLEPGNNENPCCICSVDRVALTNTTQNGAILKKVNNAKNT